MNSLQHPLRLPGLLLGLSLLLTACPDQTKPAPDTSSITAIEAGASPATLNSAATSNLTATVSGTGAFSPAVNWSVLSGGGSLSASTGASVTYTAPSVITSTTVQIKAAAEGNPNVSKTLTVTVQPASATPKPIINAFSATPASLTAAGPVTLIWDVSDATSLSIDSGVGVVTGTSKAVNVTSTTAFTLTATNANGSSTKTVTVAVAAQDAPPTVMSISPASGATGVKADAKIVITFSQPMDEASTQAAYQSADLPSAGVTFDWNASSTMLTVKPNAPLVYAAGSDPKAVVAKAYAFSLTSAAKDKSGHALVKVDSNFKTLRAIKITLYSTEDLSGFIKGSTTLSASYYMHYFVGDDLDNLGVRSFVSFDLSSLPSSLTSPDIVSATLMLYKDGVSGDPYRNLNPCVSKPPISICISKWVPVNLDHVMFGATLGTSAYATPVLPGSTVID